MIIGFLTIVALLYLIFTIAISLCSEYQTFLFLFVILCFATAAWNRIWKKKKNRLKIHIPQSINKSSPKGLQFLYFSIVLILSIVYWLGNFPGGFNLDAYGQWMQAHGLLQYNDWHPFISTLLIQLVLQIKDSFAFYIAVQIVAFAASVSYLLYCIQKQDVDYRLLLAIAFYIGINPAIQLNVICMTKDVQFTILIIIMTGIFIRTMDIESEWLKSNIHIFIMTIICTLTALVRHNGVLFVVPAYLLLFLLNKPLRTRVIISCLSMIMMVLAIKGFGTSVLKVEKHDNVVGEIAGIPMNMMANALVTDKENLPQDVHSFLNTIADDKMWEEKHVVGEWDSCKWSFGGIDLLKNNTVPKLFHYTIETIHECPQACYEAFRESTRIVWAPFGMFSEWMPYVYIEENECGISSSPVVPFKEITSFLCSATQIPVISFAFWNYGFFCSALLLLFVKIPRSQKTRSALLVFPQFTYTVGTMLLLSGPSQRYFFCGIVLIPSILLSILYKPTIRLQLDC